MWHFGPNLRSLAQRKLTLFLVVIQLAIATSIVTNLGYVVQVLNQNMRFATGIDNARLFSLMLRPADSQGVGYPRVESELRRLEDLPGVAAAAAVRWAPLSFLANRTSLAIRPETDAPKTELRSAEVSPTALRTLGLPLVAGRDFTPGDMAPAGGQPASVIISQAAARALFGDAQRTVGQTLYTVGHSYTVIGVSGDWAGFSRPFLGGRELTLFLPAHDAGSSEWRYLVRSRADRVTPELVAAATQLLTGLYQNRLLLDVERVDRLFEAGFAQDKVFRNLFVVLLVFLGFVVALAIGGQTLFWVNQQQRSLGIRRALGASRAQILALVLQQNLLMALPGLLLGIALALWFARIIQSVADMLPPLPPVFLLFTCVALLTLVLASAALPAWRAGKVSPSLATRRTGSG